MLEEHTSSVGAQFITPSPHQSITMLHCDLTGEEHCITCSDEALPAKILSIDSITGLALVTVKDSTEEIDISLVDDVGPGDMVLAHGGIAIANLEEANNDE